MNEINIDRKRRFSETDFRFTPDYSLALGKDFFMQDTATAAKLLLGKVIVRKLSGGEIVAGKIVETEAYLAENDFASHSAPGRTMRNAAMFEAGGIIYVYKIYGIHHCLNIVTETAGRGAAVLIRALQPLLGIDAMLKARGVTNIKLLCKGPGCAAKAMGFTLKDDFQSICTSELFVQDTGNIRNESISTTKRIGITKSAELPLRFTLKDCAFLSRR